MQGMKSYEIIASTRFQDAEARRVALVAGTGYGLIYALAFGLTAWGYDTLVLARIHAELAWVKLAVGLPILLLIGAVAGHLAGRKGRAGIWIAVWSLCAALMALLVGAMPFLGYNVAIWAGKPRARFVNVYPMHDAESVRMVFVAAITGFMGTVAGLVAHLLLEKAWDLSSAGGRMSLRSWAVLLLGVPIAVLPGMACDNIVNSELRARQRVVYDIISTGPDEGGTHGNVDPYRGQFSSNYTLHLVSYDLEGQKEVVDVAFDNGFAVRCTVLGLGLAGCPPVSPRFEAWMDALIQDALEGGQGTRLREYADRLSVGVDTLEWLARQDRRISENYEIIKEAQHGGWVIMSARFDTRYLLTCHFLGDAPVVLQRCELGR